MWFWISLAFAAGFLLVFGLNFLYSDVQREREKAAAQRQRQERRLQQSERARSAMGSRDLHEMAAKGATEIGVRQPIRERVALFFEQAGVRLRPEQCVLLILVCTVASALALWFVTHNWLFVILGAVVAGSAPYQYVVFKRRRRMDQLLSQLPDAFGLISRSMRAGQTFSQAMQSIAGEASPPIADEFGYCQEQENLGMSPEASLRDLARRTTMMEINVFVMAVLIHRETGGNLSDLLDKLAHLIRERYRVQGIINALTAEGRMQARVLLVLPVLMLILLNLTNPDYARTLLQHPWLLVLTALSMLAGGLWMRQIVKFKY
jgi:tight adherence protein B